MDLTSVTRSCNGHIPSRTDPAGWRGPFGMKMEGDWQSGQSTEYDYQYNGKRLEDDMGLGWNDYGARFYDPAIARFTSKDRFAEEYSFQIPYAYAANNPIKYIDVNGDSIKISNITYMSVATYGGDDQFVSDVFTALNYIVDDDADQGGVISDVANNDVTVNIIENNKENNPDNPRTKTHFNDNVDNKGAEQGDPFIIFDQNNGIEFDQYSNWIMQRLFWEKGTRSPAEGLLHVMGHAQNFLKVPKEQRKLSKQPSIGYNDAEEFRVIQSVENPVPLKLGGIKRSHHGGKFVKVKCVTCNN